jgi:F0F1-type ATP synthase membrane subunit c/vacuolar-type H+-ATPase subunit K
VAVLHLADVFHSSTTAALVSFFLQIGPKMLFGWFGHFAALAAYTVGHLLLSPLRRFSSSYTLHRLLDALQYGSASDYHYAPSAAVDKSQAAALNAKLAAGVAGLAKGSAEGLAGAGAGKGNAAQQQQQQQQKAGKAAVVVPPLGVQQQLLLLWESPEIVSHLGQQVRYT